MTARELIRFHRRHKLLLMAHSPEGLRRLGRLVAAPHPRGADATWPHYRALMDAVLQTPTTRGTHVNALQHAIGYLRPHLSADERQAVAAAIADFQAGAIALDVARRLIADHARRLDVGYLREQVYFADDDA